jgi:HAD superfamily hydrolase (TIGR01509 family)
VSLLAVAFDLDGVLIDSAHNHWRSYNVALLTYHIQLDWPQYLRIMGMRRDDALRAVARDFNIEIDIAEATRAKEQAYLELVGTDPRPILPFTSLVLRLAEHMPVALVTGSYGESLTRILPRIDLSEVFTTIVHGRDVAHGKPAPDGYLLAAERLGIEPSQCVRWLLACRRASRHRAIAVRSD